MTRVFTPQDKPIVSLMNLQPTHAGRSFASEGKEARTIGDLAIDCLQDATHIVRSLGSIAFQAVNSTLQALDAATDVSDLIMELL